MDATAKPQGMQLPDFEGWSEADVREEIIAPILNQLGYKTGTVNNVLREKAISVRYPHMYLGRKQPGKDPVLRGRPDYICEVRGVTRWALEAKPPGFDIGIDDIEQAHSYCAHPELAAPLFVVTNGRRWLIFESFRGPAAQPIFDRTQEEIARDPNLLFGVLSPAALKRRYPVRELDLGRPLSEGSGSSVDIVGGFTRYEKVEFVLEGLPPGTVLPGMDNVKKLEGYSTAIVGDRCYRDETIGIIADVRMHFPNDSMRALFEQLGLGVNRYVTRDEVISSDPLSPSIFEFSAEAIIPAGTETFDLTQFAKVVTPVSLAFSWYAEAIGHRDGDAFKGIYTARLLVQPDIEGMSVDGWLFIRGAYEVKLREL